MGRVLNTNIILLHSLIISKDSSFQFQYIFVLPMRPISCLASCAKNSIVFCFCLSVLRSCGEPICNELNSAFTIS